MVVSRSILSPHCISSSHHRIVFRSLFLFPDLGTVDRTHREREIKGDRTQASWRSHTSKERADRVAASPEDIAIEGGYEYVGLIDFSFIFHIQIIMDIFFESQQLKLSLIFLVPSPVSQRAIP